MMKKRKTVIISLLLPFIIILRLIKEKGTLENVLTIGKSNSMKESLITIPGSGLVIKEEKRKTNLFSERFMKVEFQAYKNAIDHDMESIYHLSQKEPLTGTEKCQVPLWTGEFGMELRAMTPWAYHLRDECGGIITTQGTLGTKYLYFYSNHHTIVPNIKRGSPKLPKGNPYGQARLGVHQPVPTKKWRAPPYAEFFHRPEMKKMIQPNKPLVVILNKYTKEWRHNPINYFSVETLCKMLDYLTPKYTVLYKGTTPKALAHQSMWELNEEPIIRKDYPDVLFFDDFSYGLEDMDDFNLLLFGFLSLSQRFLTVQGGTAVLGSYFGGTNIILIKEGKELKAQDYKTFHRFSNAKVVQTEKDEAFLYEMRKNM